MQRRVERTSRSAWSTAAVVTASLLLGGCQTSAQGEDDQAEGSTVLDPEVVSPSASSSTPSPVARGAFDCTRAVVDIAERVLTQRQRGIPATDCGPGLGTDQFDNCWTHCDGSTSFVDFDLDHSQPMQIDEPDDDAETVLVTYAARYASDSGGTFTEAATFTFTRPTAGEAWELVTVESIDINETQRAAGRMMDRYFSALRASDYALAAALMAPATSVGDRDDLGRLADEGLLTGPPQDQLADALERWCDRGAECIVMPKVEVEVASTHSFRAIATYQLAHEMFETTFLVDDDGIVGLPIKVE